MSPIVAMDTSIPPPTPVSRLDHEFEDLNERFRLPVVDRNYHKQFASLYTRRLETSSKLLEARAVTKWGSEAPIKKLYQIQDAGRCILIGTLHRRMALRPSILAEVSEDYHLQPPLPPRKRFAADQNDTLCIEDQVQRIPLAGKIDVKDFVTGVTLAVIGAEAKDESGRFVVEDYLCLGQGFRSDLDSPYLSSAPTSEDSLASDAPHLLLVSGLNFGSKNPDNIFPSQFLADFVTGCLGDSSLPVSNIVRVIVAGNSVSKETQGGDWAMGPKFRQKKTNQESLDALKDIDEWLQPIVSSVDVDLLPGESDPASFLWPQQPMHSCLFPQSSRCTGFHSRPNPYAATISGKLVFGTSGQNVSNIVKCSSFEGEMQALRKTIEWRHVAPTAPDTLGCYPFLDRDPFVMESRPDLYFAGNCAKFEQCWVPDPIEEGKGTLCVTLPEFSKTHSAVLVNLATLSCKAIFCKDLEMDLDAE